MSAVSASMPGVRRSQAEPCPPGRDFASGTVVAARASEDPLELRRLRRRNAELQRSHACVDQLTAASTAFGLEGLIHELAVVARAPVRVELGAPGGAAPGVTSASRMAQRDGDEWVFPVFVRARAAGTLRVKALRLMTPSEHRALEHGARLIAIHLQQEVAPLDVDERTRGALIEELLATGEPADERLARQLLRAGLDLSRPHRVVVVRSESGRPLDARRCAGLAFTARPETRQRHDPVFFAEMGGQLVCFLSEDLDNQSVALAEAMRRVACLEDDVASAGLSALHSGVAVPLREAQACAALARRGTDPGTTVEADRLGSLRFILAQPDRGPVTTMVRDQLGPLVAHDRERSAFLTSTLRAFLELGGNQAAIAARCHIHVSTVKYRMKRIVEILQRDPGDPEVRFDLMLAYKAADLFAALGEDVLAVDAPGCGPCA